MMVHFLIPDCPSHNKWHVGHISKIKVFVYKQNQLFMCSCVCVQIDIHVLVTKFTKQQIYMQMFSKALKHGISIIIYIIQLIIFYASVIVLDTLDFISTLKKHRVSQGRHIADHFCSVQCQRYTQAIENCKDRIKYMVSISGAQGHLIQSKGQRGVKPWTTSWKR